MAMIFFIRIPQLKATGVPEEIWVDMVVGRDQVKDLLLARIVPVVHPEVEVLTEGKEAQRLPERVVLFMDRPI